MLHLLPTPLPIPTMDQSHLQNVYEWYRILKPNLYQDTSRDGGVLSAVGGVLLRSTCSYL